MWLIIAALCAFFVKGLSGFANTLIFTSVLSFTSNNILISPVELLLGYPSNMIVVWKERKHIDWKVCISLAILVIAGSLPGIFILKNVDAQIIKLIFGVVVVFIGIEMFFREYSNKNQKGSKLILGFIGLLSGLLCGMYGIGALLAAYISRVSDNSKSFKANICMVFLVENTFRIVTYSIVGIITIEALKISITLVPFMLLGLFLGMKSSAFLNEKIIKKVIILILIGSGAALIVSNI